MRSREPKVTETESNGSKYRFVRSIGELCTEYKYTFYINTIYVECSISMYIVQVLVRIGNIFKKYVFSDVVSNASRINDALFSKRTH